MLSARELRDGLWLAALALLVIALVPEGPVAWLGKLQPRSLLLLVVLIMAMQAAAQVALRWFGPRLGALLGGFAAGFVSSLACVASLGAHARIAPEEARIAAAGAAMSGAATWVQALAMCALLAPMALPALVPIAAAGALGAALGAVRLLRAGRGLSAAASTDRSALRPREALTIGLLLAGVGILVDAAQQRYGAIGLDIGVALAALLDSHAPMASALSLHAADHLPLRPTLLAILIAVGANTVTRCTVALLAGGRTFGVPVSAALAVSLAMATAVAGATAVP